MSDIETMVEGKRHPLLSTRTEAVCVLDTWEQPDRLEGSVAHTVVVATVLVGQEVAAERFHQWDVAAYAVVDIPAGDPLERFQDALRQAHQRYEERMSDGAFSQAWPPAAAGHPA